MPYSLLLLAMIPEPESPFLAPPIVAGPRYTKDRLSIGRMRELVAEPLAMAEAGKLAQGRAAFEALLARSGGGEAADLLTSFGVSLYILGLERDEDELRRASLPYLERAVGAAEARFGPDDPETALALNSYADAQVQLAPDDPPAWVEQAYDRAYRIRLRALGPLNAETLFVLFRLAETKGLQSRTHGDPARIAEAAALMERVIAGREANPDQPDYESADGPRRSLIRLYVRNNMVEKAMEVARKADAAGRNGDDACFGNYVLVVANELEQLGRKAEAAAIAPSLRTTECPSLTTGGNPQ